jgi:hypothetical protein
MTFEKALQAEIRRLRARLASLTTINRAPSGTPAKSAGRRRRKSSPKLKAQRKLQGSYMGHVRRLTAAQKKHIANIQWTKGYEKAIAAAKKLRKTHTT